MLAVCGSSLEELNLSIAGLHLPLSSWLAPLSRLRVLRIRGGESGASITGSLQQLTALESLNLSHAYLRTDSFTPAIRLPQSLTFLCLGFDPVTDAPVDALPSQVGMLTNLRALELRYAQAFSGEGYTPLLHLSKLEELLLHGVDLEVPACLSQLTWLRALAYEDHSQTPVEVAQMLQHLTALTRLELSDVAAPLPQLAELHQLRKLSLWSGNTRPLPGGAWLGGLQQLTFSPKLFIYSRFALAAATKLEELRVFQVDEHQLLSIAEWAERRPRLQKLVFELPKEPISHDTWLKMLELQRRRPDLLIEGLDCIDGLLMMDSMHDIW